MVVNGRILIRALDVGLLFTLAGCAYIIATGRRIGRLWRGWNTGVLLDGCPRRIVFLIHDLGCGGAQRQLVLLLKYLDRAQWLPEVVVMDMTDPFFAPELERLSVPIVHVQPHRIFWSSVVWCLVKHLVLKPCHILHSWLPNSIHAGAIAGAIVGVPVIIASMRSESPDCVPQKVERWRRAIDMISASLSTVLLGNSQAVCETNQLWTRVSRNRMETVYNGVEVDSVPDLAHSLRDRFRTEKGLPVDAPIVGIIARIDEDKDHATFLQVARHVHAKRPDARFAIIGDGPLRSDVSEAITSGEMSGYVSMLGRCEDVQLMMQLLDVVVLTSVSEGCPNVLIEAAELGVPTVTTAAGGAVELVVDGQTGFVVPCKDSSAMADRIIQILSNRKMRHSIIQAARSRVRTQFSMSKIIGQLEDVYRRAVTRADAGKGFDSPIRVCFVLSQVYGVFRPHPDRVFGGAEVQVANLAKQLARRGGCEVYVLTGDHQRNGREEIDGVTVVLDPFCGPCHSHSSDPPDSFNEHRERTAKSKIVEWGYQWLAWCPHPLATLSRSFVRGGVICKNVLLRVLPIDWCVHAARSLVLMLRWVRLLRSINADVFVTRCAGTSVGFIQMACSLVRRPFIYMVAHDMDVSGDYVATYPVEGAMFERGLRRADVVVCQNEGQAALLLKQYRRQGHVIPSLCPFEIVAGSDHGSRESVIWIARVDDWKQPELFIRLAMRIPDQSFVMVAVASQVNPTQLENIYKAAKVIPNLKLLPAVPLHETGRLFREAAVFVNTSKVEGFPNTFLQAAASGTPIISWAVNPDNMLDRYEMGFCAQEDWSRFEQSVRLLCRDSALRARMGENGLQYVRQRHNPNLIAQTYLKLFSDLRSGSIPTVFRDSGNGTPDRSALEQPTEPNVLSPAKAD